MMGAQDAGYGTDKPRDDAPTRSAAQLTPKECVINEFRSPSCILGTRGCEVQHKLIPSEAGITSALQGCYGLPFVVYGGKK
jgi:hypothetical protein